MNVFVARQPILDQRGQLFGYELLFRDSMDNYFRHQDGDVATSHVISNSFYLMNLEQLTKGKRAFINFTSNLLKQGMATILPKRLVVIEILESVDAEPEIINVCRKLKEMGYLLALDDFVFREEYQLLIELADIIKIDLKQTKVADQIAWIEKLGITSKARLLAEKVETYEDFELAKRLGYNLFQGYYFSHPAIVQGKDIPPFKVNYLRLLQEVNRPDFRIEVIDYIIRGELSLSYKLLKFINSSAFGFKTDIASIRQALVLLGPVEFRKWISVLIMGSISKGKPHELVHQSYVRATFTELLAPKVGLGEKSSTLFLMGLFSLIDACLDRPLQEILQDLPIEDTIKKALIGFPNVYHDLLDLVIAYEQGDWEKVSHIAHRFNLKEEFVPTCYVSAIASANKYINEGLIDCS